MMARMPDLSRRAVLGLGASATLGAVGAYALDMALLPRTSRAAPAPPIGTNVPLAPARPLDPPPPAQAAPTMTTGSFVSAARGGITTNWAIARPPGQTQPLRPVIALHGKGSDAATVMAGGVEQGLAQAVNAGLPPFAVVAVDGGGSYWHKRASGEDSGAMVLDELIPMLDSQRLDTSRVAFLGWSMGGYGALLLGGRLGPARTAAICAVSPALWTSAGAAAPGAFDGAADYAANSVWGMPALGSIPIRVDCGDSDPFYSATKQFIAQLPNPPAGGFSPGGHNGGFWSSQLPAELTWMAPRLVA
ncbi:alpha/beta hydrolase-fold protein [Mycobacterium ulcerans]|uniref:Acyl-CoA:diacylglycerol acyltransferase n=1 Tax=Mycobacterium ulcerans TaxID=1809 RepID=A0ABY3VF12_MYCUL|nr:alpha/beta hydrolase-fold protein [Mycobacterium ulcerans]MEB3970336.1 alpha/beta hydrolase-fold protein [Mycobacterium ulcerans]MEB3978600.1 alpha/beta hydrolase-fold protein [Mycobacterium ulcerans]MEB4007845.1 alpha/beta hydrolase-fold protein [Mycobacterium ulcerans]MEB4417461.1 alpha/beta hydrolase-fold protein [Mycobacterium ulcerans]MEB4435595.1 alpha/beta hydrolase-fold protein [Mycobacterium ulcerans]